MNGLITCSLLIVAATCAFGQMDYGSRSYDYLTGQADIITRPSTIRPRNEPTEPPPDSGSGGSGDVFSNKWNVLGIVLGVIVLLALVILAIGCIFIECT